jgi:quercetin dioxygenase-like cupin family protein
MSRGKQAVGTLDPGEVVDVAGLVAYGADAIVSRTLVKSPAGTITLFAFDAGQELSEHTAPFDAFVQVIDGRGCFTVDGRAHDLETGDALLMPADIPHAVRADEQFKMVLTMLRG